MSLDFSLIFYMFVHLLHILEIFFPNYQFGSQSYLLHYSAYPTEFISSVMLWKYRSLFLFSDNFSHFRKESCFMNAISSWSLSGHWIIILKKCSYWFLELCLILLWLSGPFYDFSIPQISLRSGQKDVSSQNTLESQNGGACKVWELYIFSKR